MVVGSAASSECFLELAAQGTKGIGIYPQQASTIHQRQTYGNWTPLDFRDVKVWVPDEFRGGPMSQWGQSECYVQESKGRGHYRSQGRGLKWGPRFLKRGPTVLRLEFTWHVWSEGRRGVALAGSGHSAGIWMQNWMPRVQSAYCRVWPARQPASRMEATLELDPKGNKVLLRCVWAFAKPIQQLLLLLFTVDACTMME